MDGKSNQNLGLPPKFLNSTYNVAQSKDGIPASGQSKSGGNQRYRNVVQAQSMPESERGNSVNIAIKTLDVNQSQESQVARDYTGGPMTAQNNKRHSYATAVRPRFRTIDHTSPAERPPQSLMYSKKNVSRGRQQQTNVVGR